ncbi:hypothetical protein [Altericroceibacterium spongiae]|uniref:hypothetical protein n=1 Tax=Altericroceibacterium spongiae TaxID=2320269 RepID=UPI0016020354|nr:hypothetical protein [Altericroceibacterium spongiae]
MLDTIRQDDPGAELFRAEEAEPGAGLRAEESVLGAGSDRALSYFAPVRPVNGGSPYGQRPSAVAEEERRDLGSENDFAEKMQSVPAPVTRPLAASRYGQELPPLAHAAGQEQRMTLSAPHTARRAIAPRRQEARPAFDPSDAVLTAPVPEDARGETGSRWSADGWLLLRPDDETQAAPSQPSYGRSQMGAVLRYKLTPGSSHRPQAYIRGSQALQGVQESEAAAGLSVRPLPDIPVALSAEARVTKAGATYDLRPSIFAVSEFPPFALPLGSRAEVYLQGGYVGGRWKTPFVDGQARIDRPAGTLGPAGFQLGVGLWGGAQKGTSRVDFGPGLLMNLQLGRAMARFAADWRFRVAGNAEPGSGPVLTVSAGF